MTGNGSGAWVTISQAAPCIALGKHLMLALGQRKPFSESRSSNAQLIQKNLGKFIEGQNPCPYYLAKRNV